MFAVKEVELPVASVLCPVTERDPTEAVTDDRLVDVAFVVEAFVVTRLVVV